VQPPGEDEDGKPTSLERAGKTTRGTPRPLLPLRDVKELGDR
jgi:hypothetical protein